MTDDIWFIFSIISLSCPICSRKDAKYLTVIMLYFSFGNRQRIILPLPFIKLKRDMSLTHFDKQGNAQIVNVSGKAVTHRVAVAEGRISLKEQTLQAILEGQSAKGDVLGVARIAGIMAAKRTSELIPLCHPIGLSSVDISFELNQESPTVICRSRAEVDAKTGVEMEAITAVQIALLTIYDMCKAIDRGMVIGNVCLIEKSGGRSGTWQRQEND